MIWWLAAVLLPPCAGAQLALHESGHAISSLTLGSGVRRFRPWLTKVGSRRYFGYVEYDFDYSGSQRWKNAVRAVVPIAGAVVFSFLWGGLALAADGAARTVFAVAWICASLDALNNLEPLKLRTDDLVDSIEWLLPPIVTPGAIRPDTQRATRIARWVGGALCVPLLGWVAFVALLLGVS